MQKIMIVEDDEKVRDELEIFLNNNGYQAETLKKFEYVTMDEMGIHARPAGLLVKEAK